MNFSDREKDSVYTDWICQTLDGLQLIDSNLCDLSIFFRDPRDPVQDPQIDTNSDRK